jgi:hypothetical protein
MIIVFKSSSCLLDVVFKFHPLWAYMGICVWQRHLIVMGDGNKATVNDNLSGRSTVQIGQKRFDRF